MSLKTKLGLVSWFVLDSFSAGCGSAPARDLHLQTSFRIEPGQERYECYRRNVEQDVFVTKIATSAAAGVHHQILAVADQTEPEGVSECSSVLLTPSVTGISVGTGTSLQFAMPAGVAYRIPGGSQLVLQTHLFNAGDAPLESTLTADLTGIAEADVVSFAQLVEAGSLQIDLPPGSATTVTGKCTLAKDVSVFGLLPHMHSLGTAFKAWIVNGSESTTLYDDTFFGETQQFVSLAPVAMPKGAPLNIECDYFNGSGARVIYGSSARDEMCFGIAYYYPAIDDQGPLCLR